MIKNKDLKNMLSALKKLKVNDWKAKMTIVRNIKVIEREIEVLEELKKPSEQVMSFEKEKLEIIKQYAKKDEKGRPVQKFDEGRPYYDVAKEDEAHVNSLILDLAESEEFKDALAEYFEAQRQFEEAMNSVVAIELFKLNEDVVSKTDITVDDLSILYEIIDIKETEPIKMEVVKNATKRKK